MHIIFVNNLHIYTYYTETHTHTNTYPIYIYIYMYVYIYICGYVDMYALNLFIGHSGEH